MTIRRWILSATLLLLPVPAFADFQYQQDKDGVFYTADDEPQILSRLPDVSYSHLRRIADLSHPQDPRPLIEINPDSHNCDDNHICQHAYLSDGRFILWAGKSSRIPGMSLPLMLPASVFGALPPINTVSI